MTADKSERETRTPVLLRLIYAFVVFRILCSMMYTVDWAIIQDNAAKRSELVGW